MTEMWILLLADAVYDVEAIQCLNSLRLDSDQASISIPNTGMGFGTGSWTFEYWIQIHDGFTNSSSGTIMMMNESYSAYAFRSFYYGDSSYSTFGKARCYTYNNTSGSHNLDNGYTDVINDGEWHHIACSYSGGTLQVFTDGVLTTTDSGNPSLNASSGFTIGEPRSGIYASYEAAPVNLGPIRISSTNRYSTGFTPVLDWSIDGNTVAQYLTTTDFDGQTLIDEAGGDNTGTVRDDVIVPETCPEEDLDGDGYAAWEDCDDNDANLINNCTCSATSEMYWLDGTLASDIGVSNWMVTDYGCNYGYNHLTASDSEQWCSAFYHDYAGGCSDKKWVVIDCSSTSNGRICEKSGTNNCNGSTYNGNCYKYESHSGDWFDARLACEAWGGSLVSIEESAEHDFVKSLMNPGHYRAWIGLTNFDGAEVCVE